MNLLFLCTSNSCRPILGEATFNHLAPARWRAMSAGSRAARSRYVYPHPLALLAREGIAAENYYSKSPGNLPATSDHLLEKNTIRDQLNNVNKGVA